MFLKLSQMSYIKYFLEDISPFVGSLVLLFWTSDVCPGFQSHGGSPRLRASLLKYYGLQMIVAQFAKCFCEVSSPL